MKTYSFRTLLGLLGNPEEFRGDFLEPILRELKIPLPFVFASGSLSIGPDRAFTPRKLGSFLK
jgi:hypothetical protein